VTTKLTVSQQLSCNGVLQQEFTFVIQMFTFLWQLSGFLQILLYHCSGTWLLICLFLFMADKLAVVNKHSYPDAILWQCGSMLPAFSQHFSFS